MAEYEYNIENFEDLKFAKQQIKQDIKKQETSFKNNPLVKISSSLFGGGSSNSVKSSLFNSLSSKDGRSGSKMIKTLLLANRSTRKYFIAYTIAKEMIPFTLDKINGLFKE
ncbi:MAG: hypothetical protein KAH67_10075 [Flavobacteriaceae bacterium]|nr:hypothetical protein [Flavobacteriaceae bacterium]